MDHQSHPIAVLESQKAKQSYFSSLEYDTNTLNWLLAGLPDFLDFSWQLDRIQAYVRRVPD